MQGTNGGNTAELSYLELHPEDILGAAESLGYRADGSLLALNSYENRVYRIGLENAGHLVAKFYRPGRWSDAAIREEHRFATELAAAEVPVLAPLGSGDNTLFRHGDFRFALFEYRAGRAPELDDLKLLQQLGRLVARIHLHGDLCAFEHRPLISIESFGEQSQEFLSASGFIPADILPAYSSLCNDALDQVECCFERAEWPRDIRLHGDFHPGNVLIDGEQLYIVDLDDARMGPAVQDLWMFLSGNSDEQTPQLEALLEGYTQFRPFDARELHIIEALRTLRIMHYAAWLARRWNDPAFRQAFPWFGGQRYWEDHVLALREQLALMQEEPLYWAN